MEWQRLMLDCGSPLYVCEMPHAHSLAQAALVHVGTRDETWPQEAGLAHALEHMMFQGAGPFPNSGVLAMEIEKTGGWLNAWTSEEATAYHNCVPPECVEDALRVLAAQIYHPRFLEDKIETEMSNIIEEIKMHKDNPLGHAARLFGQTIFGAHPLGKDTLGLKEALKSFKLKDFRSFHERFYHEKNLVFVVAGAIHRQDALRLFNQHFTGSPFVSGRIVSSRTTEAATIVSSPSIVEEKEIDQANIVIGWVSAPASSRKAKVLRHFREMIGGGMGFPLFQEVRDERGLCYSVKAFADSYTDSGVFFVYIGTDAKRVQEALDAIHEVVSKHNTNQNLLEIVRRKTSGELKLSSETSAGILQRALFEIASGQEPQSFEEAMREVESVTIGEVESAVNQYLARESAVSVMIMPRTGV